MDAEECNEKSVKLLWDAFQAYIEAFGSHFPDNAPAFHPGLAEKCFTSIGDSPTLSGELKHEEWHHGPHTAVKFIMCTVPIFERAAKGINFCLPEAKNFNERSDLVLLSRNESMHTFRDFLKFGKKYLRSLSEDKHAQFGFHVTASSSNVDNINKLTIFMRKDNYRFVVRFMEQQISQGAILAYKVSDEEVDAL